MVVRIDKSQYFVANLMIHMFKLVPLISHKLKQKTTVLIIIQYLPHEVSIRNIKVDDTPNGRSPRKD